MSNDASREARATTKHYRILDALRFLLAFWVAMGHSGIFPLFAGVDSTAGFGRFLTHAWNTVVFATPAVIVFFVISGFCIHLPFIGDKKLSIWRYYLRRYTRILIPVAGALCVYRLWGQRMVFWGEHSVLWESPLWSLACEEIYYAAYPLLRWARNYFGWKKFLPAAFLAGVGAGLTHPHALGWHAFSPFGTALILLPVWLLGCLLAEQGEAIPIRSSTARIWGWRFLAWLGCWTSEMLHFKVGVPILSHDLVWRPRLFLGPGGNRVRKVSAAQFALSRCGSVELFAVSRSRSGNDGVRAEWSAESWLQLELDRHDVVRPGICVPFLHLGGEAIAPAS